VDVVRELDRIGAGSKNIMMRHSAKEGFFFKRVHRITSEKTAAFAESADEFVRVAKQVPQGTDLVRLDQMLMACYRVMAIGQRILDQAALARVPFAPNSLEAASRGIDSLVALTDTIEAACASILGCDAVDVSAQDSLLFALVADGQFAAALQAMQAGCDVHRCNEKGQTVLHTVAASEGKEAEAVAHVLIEKGANVHVKDQSDVSVFHEACSSKHLQLIKTLYKMAVDVRAITSYGNTALILLIRNLSDELKEDEESYKKVVELALLLIEQEVDIHAVNQDGKTALYYALASGCGEVAEKLVELKADYLFTAKDGTNALSAAAKGGQETLALQFLDWGVSIPEEDENLLSDACAGMKQLSRRLLALGCRAPGPQWGFRFEGEEPSSNNLRKALDFIPLCLVTGETTASYSEAAQELVHVVFTAYSALTNAIECGDEELALLVAEQARDITVREWQSACEKKMVKLALYICTRITVLQRFQGSSESYLLAPTRSGLEEVALELIQRGAPLQDLDAEGFAPMLLAMKANMPRVVDALAARGVPLQQRAKSGFSSTHALFGSALYQYFGQILQLTGGADMSRAVEVVQNTYCTPMKCLARSSIQESLPSEEIAKAWKHLFATFNPAQEESQAQKHEVVEFFLLLQEIPRARAVLMELPESERAPIFSNLQKKYPKADFTELYFNMAHDVDVAHIDADATTIEVPQKPLGIEMEALLPHLDGLEFTAGELFQLTQEDRDDLKGFLEKTLFKRIREQDIKGLSKRDYQEIESALCHIAKALVQQPNRKKEAMQALLNAVNLCGGRLYNMAIDQYMKVVEGVPETYEAQVMRALAAYRKNLLEGVIPDDEQSLHDSHKLMKKIGKQYAIPGWNKIEKFEDIYLDSGNDDFDLEAAEWRWKQLYNPYAILTMCVEPLLHDGDIRALATKWHAEHAPLEHTEDPIGYVTKHVLEGSRVKQSATLDSLKKLGVIKAVDCLGTAIFLA